VALVQRRAGDGCPPNARPCLTGVTRGTTIAVAAYCSVVLDRVRAGAGRGIARSGSVALVECRASHRISARAGTALAGVGPCARIVVVARRPVRCRGIRAGTRARVADSGDVTRIGWSAGHRCSRRAGSAMTGVSGGAFVTVVARQPLDDRGIRTNTSPGVASPRGVALVLRSTNHGIASDAQAALASIGLRTGVSVVAYGTVWL
jgi:hypothetical protein